MKDVRFLTATNDFMPADNKHYVTLFMVCRREDEGDEPRVLETEKCERWEWVSWEELVRWVELEEEERKGSEGGKGGRKLFAPLLNLVRQRPGVRPGDA